MTEVRTKQSNHIHIYLPLVTALLSPLAQDMTGSGKASMEQPSLRSAPSWTRTSSSSRVTVGGSGTGFYYYS